MKLLLIFLLLVSNVCAVDFVFESLNVTGTGYHESYYSGYIKSDRTFYNYIIEMYGTTKYRDGQCLDFARDAGKYFQNLNYTVLYVNQNNHAWILIKELNTDKYLALDYTENYLSDEVYYNPDEIYYSFTDLNNSIFRYKEVFI
jgi:hypothetical protein